MCKTPIYACDIHYIFVIFTILPNALQGNIFIFPFKYNALID